MYHVVLSCESDEDTQFTLILYSLTECVKVANKIRVTVYFMLNRLMYLHINAVIISTPIPAQVILYTDSFATDPKAG